MGKPYSMDLRERVVAAVVKGGMSCHQAAAQFGLGVNTVDSTGCGDGVRPAALRRARWAVISRRRLRVSIVAGCWNGSNQTSPCAGWLPNSPGAD